MGGRGENPACPRCRTTRRRGCCARSAMPAARCGRGSPRCATSVCSSRPAAICWTWRWPRRSTRAGSTGPRVVPAGHAITPTGGHLDPTMFAAFAPHVLELTVEEGIANGVDEIRKAVRYQIKHGAAADQGLLLGRRHVADGSAWRTALFGRGAARDRRRGAPAWAARGRAHARRRCGQARGRGRYRLHRARLPDRRRGDRDDGRARHLPGVDRAAWPKRWTSRMLRQSCRPRPPRCSRSRAPRYWPPTKPA